MRPRVWVGASAAALVLACAPVDESQYVSAYRTNSVDGVQQRGILAQVGQPFSLTVSALGPGGYSTPAVSDDALQIAMDSLRNPLLPGVVAASYLVTASRTGTYYLTFRRTDLETSRTITLVDTVVVQ